MKILVVNPGSTSTKIAVFEDEKQVFKLNISHPTDELSKFKEITDQFEFRKNMIVDELKKNNIEFNFNAIAGRGSLAKPVAGGVYEINDKMIEDTKNAMLKHACNLGCMISREIANEIPGCRCFIADPGVVDEMCEEARVTGSPLMPRMCIWHALNQKAIARRFAKEQGKAYEDLNLIVCHLGGGVSVAAHRNGLAIDTNNALDGEGPFSPERAGTLPAGDVVRLCFSGKYTEKEMLKMLAGKGGVTAHLGTNDMIDVENRAIAGEKQPALLLDAMAYQTAKSIAAEAAVLKGKVDAILITGGLARAKYIVDRIIERVSFIAPIHLYPGEDELEALALNALAVLRGERQAKEYV